MQNFCIIVRLTKFTYIINYTLNKVQNFCIVVGLSRFKYPIKKEQNFCIVVWFNRFECHWTKCRISASLLVQQILVSLNTECRISAPWFDSADFSVIGQGAEYLHCCWVLSSVDLGIFSHCTRCRISASSIGLILLRTLILLWLLTLFRLGFFGQSVTGGEGSSDPSSGSLEPIMLGSWNFTHNDHLRAKKPYT